MTCEVVIANRLAIALAADSAVTFSGGGSRETYASGANKIFQMARREPVAVMIYNTADLGGVPWELLIKAYRAQLDEVGFDSLEEYANDFIAFLHSAPSNLVPSEVRGQGTLSAMYNAVTCVLNTAVSARPELRAPISHADAAQRGWDEFMTQLSAETAAKPILTPLDEADRVVAHQHLLTNIGKFVEVYLQNSAEHKHLAPYVDVETLSKLAIEVVFRDGFRALYGTHTGIVVAGFGKNEFLPGFCHVEVFGLIGSRVLWRSGPAESVSFKQRPSLIQAFARQAMVETFTQGASKEIWSAVGDAYSVHSRQVVRAAAASAGVSIAETDIDVAVSQNEASFRQAWTQTMLEKHLNPLRAVVSSLNIEELAELAETLVLLESLKEKVTQRTQSVGGPIDVAVITKAEGLVWIKRKLYFDPSLNHRYFQRLS